MLACRTRERGRSGDGWHAHLRRKWVGTECGKSRCLIAARLREDARPLGDRYVSYRCGPDPGRRQRWTTMPELARDHANEVREEEPDLIGIGVTPSFGDRATRAAVRTPAGNVLWDCVPLLDEPTRERVTALGGIAAIAMFHPHFYGANVEIADAFDARVLIPNADRGWVQRTSPRIEYFDERIEPVPGGDRGPHRRAFRRRRRAAPASRVAGPRRLADRRHHHRGPRPRLGQAS